MKGPLTHLPPERLTVYVLGFPNTNLRQISHFGVVLHTKTKKEEELELIILILYTCHIPKSPKCLKFPILEIYEWPFLRSSHEDSQMFTLFFCVPHSSVSANGQTDGH